MGLPETYVSGFHDVEAVKKMEYGPLGKTNLVLSKLGIGGATYSGFYGDFEEREVADIVEHGLKTGINYIDTAPYYGAGQSEIALGKALKSRSIPRSAYYISTKVGRYQPDWATIDYSKERVQRSVDESLERLGLTYVDVIIVHDVEFSDTRQVVEETLPALKELVDQGKVRHIGISGYPLSVLMEIVEKSRVPIEVVLTYARDTLVDRTLDDFIPRLKERGIGVVTASPTGCQLLTNKGPEKWHPGSPQLKELCRKASDYCEANNVELGTLAVSYALQSTNTVVCLVGMMTKQILMNNLNLLLDGLTPKEKQVFKYLTEKIFTGKVVSHWEGVEVEIFKKHMASIGKPIKFL